MNKLDRAQGCLLGQLAGDSLGGLVEFKTAAEIRAAYPDGVRELADGGTWDTLAGQPTDDSEMALILARTLVDDQTYDVESVQSSYIYWLDSNPFDCGFTISSGLRGNLNKSSQANGALMRISPLGIFGAGRPEDIVAKWADQDAALTHPHPVCRQADILFALAIAHAIETGCNAKELYHFICDTASKRATDPVLLAAIQNAVKNPPDDYVTMQGWVMIAFQNALWQLLHAPDLESGVVDTIMRGGDTDTNAAICGALLGAVYGKKMIPGQWMEKILSCHPEQGRPDVHQPRPECFWPADALQLASELLQR